MPSTSSTPSAEPEPTKGLSTDSPVQDTGSVNVIIVQYAEQISSIDNSGKPNGQSCTSIPLTLGEDLGLGFHTIGLPQKVSLEKATSIAAEIAKCPGVISAEPEQPVSLGSVGIDAGRVSGFAQSVQSVSAWGIDRIDQRSLPLNGSYEYDTTGAGVSIYIVDTGIYSGHSEFGGRVAPGFDGMGDGRGTEDCMGHGTHVAAIAAGSTYGVAKDATLVPVRVLNCVGQEGSSSLIIRGLNWIVENHQPGVPAVANMSLVMNPSAAIDAAVRAVIADGVTVVVAAGNDGTISSCSVSPAREPLAITVNSSTRLDDDSRWSNFGSCSDLYAPGEAILSADISSPTASISRTGTSMATPHVAGAVARLLGMNNALSPAEVWSQIDAATTFVDFGLGQFGDPNKLLFVDPIVSNSNFVKNLYQDFLARAATDSEVQYWGNALNRGQITPRGLTSILATSDEWLRSSIRSFYTDTLGRDPDEAGYQYWVSQARGGMAVADIGAFFYGSEEYFNGFGQADQRTWITDLYTKLLLRTADSGGVDYWQAQLANGMNRTALSKWFYQSPEKRGLRVDALYTKLLHRGTDPGGRTYWAERLYGEGDLVLASMLSTSPEYFFRRFAG